MDGWCMCSYACIMLILRRQPTLDTYEHVHMQEQHQRGYIANTTCTHRPRMDVPAHTCIRTCSYPCPPPPYAVRRVACMFPTSLPLWVHAPSQDCSVSFVYACARSLDSDGWHGWRYGVGMGMGGWCMCSYAWIMMNLRRQPTLDTYEHVHTQEQHRRG